MAVVPQVFNGLLGTREANTLRMIPPFHTPYKQNGNRIPFVYRDVGTAPKQYNEAITYSRHRVVLPCRGITHKVIRRAPVPDAGGMQAPMGYGRGQIKGIVYEKEKPLNVKIMPFAGFYNPGLNNPLGTPK
jgi:hypothetical protein